MDSKDLYYMLLKGYIRGPLKSHWFLHLVTTRRFHTVFTKLEIIKKLFRCITIMYSKMITIIFMIFKNVSGVVQ